MYVVKRPSIRFLPPIRANQRESDFISFRVLRVFRGYSWIALLPEEKRSMKHIKHTKHTNEVSVSRSNDQTRRASLVGPHASSCAVIESRVKCWALDLPG